eukprot:scaffold40466_cov21-Tisochrysis_lutea.AAC.2
MQGDPQINWQQIMRKNPSGPRQVIHLKPCKEAHKSTGNNCIQCCHVSSKHESNNPQLLCCNFDAIWSCADIDFAPIMTVKSVPLLRALLPLNPWLCRDCFTIARGRFWHEALKHVDALIPPGFSWFSPRGCLVAYSLAVHRSCGIVAKDMKRCKGHHCMIA